jgi:hypothetical protein
MPQDKNAKYITRRDFGIYDQRLVPMTSAMGRRPDGSYRYRAGDTRTVGGDQVRGDVNARDKFSGDISDLGLSQKRPSNFTSPEGKGIAADNLIVGTRDAHNARAMRSNLASRAATAAESTGIKAKRGAAMRRGAILGGLGTGAALAAQRGASDYEPEDNTSYGRSALGGSNGSYPSQGPMSKAMKVKNTKAGM